MTLARVCRVSPIFLVFEFAFFFSQRV